MDKSEIRYLKDRFISESEAVLSSPDDVTIERLLCTALLLQAAMKNFKQAYRRIKPSIKG